MRVMLGALKGVSRGVIPLVLVAAVPLLAWAAASSAESALGMDFWSGFVGALVLEGFLGLFALIGVASEAQEGHDEAIDRERAPHGGGD